jgi:hypothetical protein
MELRKLVIQLEKVQSEGGFSAARPIVRVVACAIVANPLAGRSVDDLEPLMEMGATLGALLSDEALKQLTLPATSYGKAALVGVNGDIEHGAAVIHPRMGRPIRERIGGGKALIPSNVKIGGPGSMIDVPLGHCNDAWLFDYIDTVGLCVADGPRPDELAIILALSDGGRVHPRVGRGGAPTPPGGAS